MDGRLFLWAALCALPMAAGAQQIQVSGANRTISITTTEEASRRADVAVVHIGYQLYGATSAAVSEQAGSTSGAILKAVASPGIPNDAVESESQSTGAVQPFAENQASPEDRATRRFQAQQGWSVRTSPDEAAKVLASAVDAGANESGAIDWSVADETSLSGEAAGKALKHAQAIATQMAAGLGATLGPLVYASNEAQQLRPMVMAGPAKVRLMDAAPPAVAAKTLDLRAPMVRRSATVVAVFSLQ